MRQCQRLSNTGGPQDVSCLTVRLQNRLENLAVGCATFARTPACDITFYRPQAVHGNLGGDMQTLHNKTGGLQLTYEQFRHHQSRRCCLKRLGSIRPRYAQHEQA